MGNLRRWKIPTVEQSRLEEIMTNIEKLGCESLPVIPEPELSVQHVNVNDGMGVYELVDTEEGDDEVSDEFRRVIKKFDEETQAAA